MTVSLSQSQQQDGRRGGGGAAGGVTTELPSGRRCRPDRTTMEGMIWNANTVLENVSQILLETTTSSTTATTKLQVQPNNNNNKEDKDDKLGINDNDTADVKNGTNNINHHHNNNDDSDVQENQLSSEKELTAKNGDKYCDESSDDDDDDEGYRDYDTDEEEEQEQRDATTTKLKATTKSLFEQCHGLVILQLLDHQPVLPQLQQHHPSTSDTSLSSSSSTATATTTSTATTVADHLENKKKTGRLSTTTNTTATTNNKNNKPNVTSTTGPPTILFSGNLATGILLVHRQKDASAVHCNEAAAAAAPSSEAKDDQQQQDVTTTATTPKQSSIVSTAATNDDDDDDSKENRSNLTSLPQPIAPSLSLSTRDNKCEDEENQQQQQKQTNDGGDCSSTSASPSDNSNGSNSSNNTTNDELSIKTTMSKIEEEDTASAILEESSDGDGGGRNSNNNNNNIASSGVDAIDSSSCENDTRNDSKHKHLSNATTTTPGKDGSQAPALPVKSLLPTLRLCDWSQPSACCLTGIQYQFIARGMPFAAAITPSSCGVNTSTPQSSTSPTTTTTALVMITDVLFFFMDELILQQAIDGPGGGGLKLTYANTTLPNSAVAATAAAARSNNNNKHLHTTTIIKEQQRFSPIAMVALTTRNELIPISVQTTTTTTAADVRDKESGLFILQPRHTVNCSFYKRKNVTVEQILSCNSPLLQPYEDNINNSNAGGKRAENSLRTTADYCTVDSIVSFPADQLPDMNSLTDQLNKLSEINTNQLQATRSIVSKKRRGRKKNTKDKTNLNNINATLDHSFDDQNGLSHTNGIHHESGNNNNHDDDLDEFIMLNENGASEIVGQSRNDIMRRSQRNRIDSSSSSTIDKKGTMNCTRALLPTSNEVMATEVAAIESRNCNGSVEQPTSNLRTSHEFDEAAAAAEVIRKMSFEDLF